MLGHHDQGTLDLRQKGQGIIRAEHRREIAMLIAEVVKGWDASEVSRKIELAIGKDLQYIRINGALVGGVAGIVLHACMVL